ncbi:MAG: serine/threonine-protein kinase [Isosphaeraceae bacterium]
MFAMEYVEGLDLSRIVKAKGPLPVAHAANFAHQVALGLQHACEAGLVHRDVKPANLMLSANGGRAVVKILDFGLAKATREQKADSALTSEGQALGTPDYIAPEQIVNAPDVDIRADIYSLGGTLYYLLTGRPPFRANSLYDLYQAHMSNDADPLNFVRPEVPSELAALVAKMMAKDPARRFQQPGEIAEALRPFFKKPATGLQAQRTDLGNIIHVTPALPQPPQVLHENKTSTMAAHVEIAAVGETRRTRPETVLDQGLRPTDPPRSRVTRPRRWVTLIAVSSLLVIGLLGLWTSGVIKLLTQHGTIVVKGVPEDATVTIDGQNFLIRREGDDEITISEVPVGKSYRLMVSRSGVPIWTTDVIMKLGGRPMEVSYIPSEPSLVMAAASDAEIPLQPDHLQPGCIWKGHYEDFQPPYANLDLVLEITQRQGSYFEAIYTVIQRDQSIGIKGQVNHNHIEWSFYKIREDRNTSPDFFSRTTVSGTIENLQINCIQNFKGMKGKIVFDADLRQLASASRPFTADALPLGRNLIINGDAERFTLLDPKTPSGPARFEGWEGEGSPARNMYANYPVRHLDGLGEDFGTSYFMGGDQPSSRLAQTIDLSASAVEIDSGKVGFLLRGWLGSFPQGGSNYDEIELALQFLDQQGKPTVTHSLEGPTEQELAATPSPTTNLALLRSSEGRVPPGTRSARITMTFTKRFGVASNGLADNLRLELRQLPEAEVRADGSDGKPSKLAAVEPPADPFQAGTVWKGQRTYHQGQWAGITVSTEFHVEKRTGAAFRGQSFANGAGRNRIDVVGEIRGDKISWTERNEKSTWTVQGICSGRRIDFSFHGELGGGKTSDGEGFIILP